MTLAERAVGDITIVTVNGDITLNKGGDAVLKDKVQSLLQQGRRKLLLDLGGVSYVDSAGLGQLVHAHSTATRAGGAVKLLNINKRLKDLLIVTKLLTVFDSFDSEAAALEGFGGPTPA